MHPAKQHLTCAMGDTPARCELRWLIAGGKWSDRWKDSSATYEWSNKTKWHFYLWDFFRSL